MNTVLFALAILSLILIPLAPQLVRLRIRILRWLHWNWAVNLLEKHFDGWVLFLRMVALGQTQLRGFNRRRLSAFKSP